MAIEHDVEWAERIRRGLPDNVRVHAIPPEKGSWDPADGDGRLGDFRNYVEYPAGLGEFDFILVDGRARQACLRRARSMLAKGGIVVMHDTNRSDRISRHTAGVFRRYALFARPLRQGGP